MPTALAIIVPSCELKPMTVGRIVDNLRSLGQLCHDADRAESSEGWHMLDLMGSMHGGSDPYPTHMTFFECGVHTRILCIEFKDGGAYFHVYDNVQHAVENDPTLRQTAQVLRQLVSIQNEVYQKMEAHVHAQSTQKPAEKTYYA